MYWTFLVDYESINYEDTSQKSFRNIYIMCAKVSCTGVLEQLDETHRTPADVLKFDLLQK
jgi:hypothetical protein